MRASRPALLGLAATAALLAVPAVRHLREQPPPAPPPMTFALAPPEGSELGSGDEALDAALSPGGEAIAFVATAGGVTSLWHRDLADARARTIPGTEGARLPAWHPDGDRIAYFANGRLRLVSLTDGSTSDLAEAPAPAGAAWLADGTLVVSPGGSGPLERLDAGTLTPASVLGPGDRAHVFPVAVGATGAFAYTAVDADGSRTVHLVSADGGDAVLGPTTGHGQIVGDRWLSIRGGTLLAQAVGEDLVPYGPSVPLASGVGVTADGRGLFVASARILITAPAVSRARLLAWFDLDGQPRGTIGEPGDFWQVRLSPDDTEVAVTTVAPLLRTLDVAVVPVAGGRQELLSLAVAADRHPVWAPDGRTVLYQSLQRGRPELLIRRTHETEAMPEPFLGGNLVDVPTDWRDSQVLAHAPDPASGQDVWVLDVSSGAREPAVQSAFNDTEGRWSPDGRSIAHVSDESGHADIYVTRVSDRQRVRVSTAGGTHPRWSRDGRSLYFLRGSWIVRADRGDADEFTTPVPLFDLGNARDFDLAHRREAILALVPAGGAPPPSVSVLVDWPSVLR